MSNDNNKDKDQVHVEADEKHLLLDHDYDGIQELNHPLPKWWNFIFYVSIFWAIGYFVYYVMMGGPSLKDEFSNEISEVKAKQAEYQKLNSAFSEVKFKEFNNPEKIAKGLEVFTANCVACHLEGGKGDVGPNLTDDSWIHIPGDAATVYNVTYKGVDDKGMPAWGEVLSSDDIYAVLAYLESIRNTFVKGGKEAQGEKVVQEKSI